MSTPSARVDELKKRYEENPRRFFAPLANEYRKSGDLDAAIDLCHMHLEEQPGHLSGHIVYGQALFEAGRAADAQQAFESALNLDPENLIALRHLGDIGKAAGDPTVATHWYQRVLEADPRNDEVIALIAALQQAAAAAVVVDDEVPEPPPPPQYSDKEDGSVELPFIDSSAPTPIIAMTAVPAPVPTASSRRESIGLMDLDLDLGEGLQPPTDLLGTVPTAPHTPVVVDDTTVAPDGPPLEVLDTSFNLGLPVEQPSTFDSAASEPEFGDSLDVIVESPAAPAAPAPGDFDMLFGSSPIADVYVGGDDTPAQADEAGFVADAFVGRELVDSPPHATPEVAITPAPFVTETMAELYLQQGFRDEALAVYRQLLAQDPSDAGLAERVLHLEHGTSSSMAIDRASQEIEAALDAESEPSPEIQPERESAPPVAPAVVEAVPAFMVAAPSVTVPPQLPAPTGPTAREVFGRLAKGRALPGDGASATVVEPEPGPLAEPFAEADSEPDAEPPVESYAEPVQVPVPAPPGGSIDLLFGAGRVNSDDEAAATAVAAAFDAASATTVKGQPTRAGTDEFSLGSVFHGDAIATPAAPAVQRQSTKLRFDQFFAGVDDSATSSPSSAAPPPTSPGRGEEDISQFNDWLKGLKGS